MRIAQFISLFLFALSAIWYARPLLNKDGARRCAQHEGFPISNAAVFEIVAGDLLGATIALLGIFLLRLRWNLGVVFSWLVVLETPPTPVLWFTGG